MFLLTAGKPIAVTHSRGHGPLPKSDNSESTDASFSSMAEIASCSYEARQVTYSAWSAILTNFCNPKIPGFGHRQSWDSGLAKSVGIRDPGIAVPTHYLRTFCGCLPVQSQNILFDISYPTPL